VGVLAICAASAQTWKEKKRTHQGLPVTSLEIFRQIAEKLSDQQDFNRNLDAILIPRTVGSRNHERVRQQISQVLSGYGWNVEEDSFSDQTPLGQKQFTNIIATHDPSAARRLVIACHYDSKIQPAGVYATDSAVPCAMMLNLAWTMRKQLKQRRSDLTLQFIFFDGEEAFQRWSSTDSIYGARHLAAKWGNQRYTSDGVTGNQNDRIDLFVLLDLLGSGDMTISREERSSARWFNRMGTIESNLKKNNLISGGTIFKNKDGNGGIEDDHIPFKRRGVPILHLISSPFPRVWHTVRDDRNALDFRKIENFNKVLRVFVAEYLGLDFSEGCNREFCFIN
jgi:glutaminyl-peptide cyclotransferase